MNSLVKTAQRVIQNSVKNTTLTVALVTRTQAPVKRDFTRGIWHMSCSKRLDGPSSSSTLLHNHSNTCSCGCGLKALHTKDTEVEQVLQAKPKPLGERELVEFLTEEIVAERKAQKLKVLPMELDGFVVCGDGAEVVLSKQLKDELVKITFNVNHTVDSDEMEGEVQPEKQEFAEMRSRPQFEVDLIRGDTTLGFTCSYLQEPPAANASADEFNDIFGIDELTIYKGQWNDKVYAVAGDVLDGYLYDLLMNLLEEKGISNDFVQKLSDFSTAYEHSAYINLLETVSQFTIGKQ